ncbi:MAG: hypothetical protein R3Y53_01125 [Bacillota bacterium]
MIREAIVGATCGRPFESVFVSSILSIPLRATEGRPYNHFSIVEKAAELRNQLVEMKKLMLE